MNKRRPIAAFLVNNESQLAGDPMRISDVLNKEFKTTISSSNGGNGHWLLKNGRDSTLPLYSTNTTLKGSDILQQVATMEEMKRRLSEAQAGLIALLDSE